MNSWPEFYLGVGINKSISEKNSLLDNWRLRRCLRDRILRRALLLTTAEADRTWQMAWRFSQMPKSFDWRHFRSGFAFETSGVELFSLWHRSSFLWEICDLSERSSLFYDDDSISIILRSSLFEIFPWSRILALDRFAKYLQMRSSEMTENRKDMAMPRLIVMTMK